MNQNSLFDSMENRYVANCDGGCRGNPGPGALGVSIRNELTGELIEFFEAEEHTTNNKQELKAAIAALKVIPAGAKVTLRTDSQYVVKGITEWLPGWKRRGWKNSAGNDVANRDLWEALDALLGKHKVTFTWVKGHAGDPGNERADELTNQGMDSLKKRK